MILKLTFFSFTYTLFPYLILYIFSNVKWPSGSFCHLYFLFLFNFPVVLNISWMSYNLFDMFLPPQAQLIFPHLAFLDSLELLDPEEFQVQLVSKASEVHTLTSVSHSCNMFYKTFRHSGTYLSNYFYFLIFSHLEQISTPASPPARFCPSDCLTSSY